MSMIVVSHYERFYELIQPTYTHVLVNGKIVVEGGPELAEKIDQEGYDWIYQEYDVQPASEITNTKKVSAGIGSCAVRVAAESGQK